MSTMMNILPAAACAELTGIPLTIGLARGLLRGRQKAHQPATTPDPAMRALAPAGQR